MPVSEFEIIEQVFWARAGTGRHVIQGIGDDAAVVDLPPGRQLVLSTDTLVEGVHFFPDADPFNVGHKSLAVNLSDIAAMGADPLWFMLSLTLPDGDMAWLQRYADGLFALATRYDVALIGGNMAHGPRSISITITGSVPADKALLRSSAQPGDDIYVSGEPGSAALALAMLNGNIERTAAIPPDCLERLLRPEPRIRLGQAIRPYASACIDVSDGLAADLEHLLEASGVGAQIELDTLPLHPAIQALDESTRFDVALCRGDDYELCFTAPVQHRQHIFDLQALAGCRISRIGTITAASGLGWLSRQGRLLDLPRTGYRHF